MRKFGVAAIATLALVTALSACEAGDEPGEAGTTATTTTAPDLSVHESGPESPIAYGLQVPKGATQLGPLVRFRSARLIAAFGPELKAALAQQAAEERDQAATDLKEGKTPPTPTPTPLDRPNEDTFKVLEDPPKPDTTVSLMRVNGKPSDVVFRMISQIAAVLPMSGINTDDLSQYCTSANGRYTGCSLSVRGLTGGDRDIRILLTVDAGNMTTRTAPPAAQTRPIMTLSVEYVGEPRKGQIGRDSEGIGKLPSDNLTAPPSTLIWPKMDTDAAPTMALLNGSWRAPDGATILLSGYNPRFAALATETARQSDLISEEYVRSVADKGVFTEDVAEDLNEISTTYTATRKDGKRAFATYVLSARGNYAMLFYLPKPKV